MPKGYYTNPRTRGRMQGTVLPSVKRQYFGRLEASPAEQALRGGNLRYDGGILWAYATIVREERRTGLFARMSDDQFGDAVRAAIMADRGHEKSYVDPEWEDDEIPGVGRRRRDRWYHEHRETLLLAARENVLMWAREWRRT